MFKIKFWTVKVKTEALVKSSTFEEKLSLIKASVISILIGLIVGILFVFCNGENGFLFIWTAISRSLTTNINRTLVYFGCYTLIGLGLSLGFKLKIFNMGGSGQILTGLIMTFVITNTLGTKDPVTGQMILDTKYAPLVFFVTVLSGMTISTLTGALKVYLNVHEVASSILLNWTFWYLLKWYMTIIGNAASTPSLNENMAMMGNSVWALCVLCALFAVVITYIVISYTTTGYRLKIVGMSPSVAKYSGIKSSYYILIVMAAQGAFISIGGFFYYFLIQGSLTFSKDLVPQIGFDGIPVALVAFNNVLGIVPIALFWGIFKEGAAVAITTPELNSLQPEVADLIFGIIIYCSTLYILFFKFNPLQKIKEKLYVQKDIVTKNQIIDYKAEIKKQKLFLKNISQLEELVEIRNKILKTNKEDKNKIASLKELYNEVKIFHYKKHHKNIQILKQNINDLIKNGYLIYKQSSIKGLKLSYSNKKFQSIFSALDNIIKQISDFEDQNKVFNTQIKEIKRNIKNQLKFLKKSMINDSNLLESIDKLKKESFDKIQKIQNEKIAYKKSIETKSLEIINVSNNKINNYKKNYINSFKKAKDFLNKLLIEYKNDIKNSNQQEKFNIKKKYFEKLMEVKEKHDRLH
ncbi:ABC transporter permease [Spiroplasma endosymbiont of Atherix ibis]|uniref:ABC transporter permease n=1 Tax=Spiroplasma endosymbiont of Atherix ibis TaxID=3066291 RepID=UPI0030CF0687